jgi:hypothetical protein
MSTYQRSFTAPPQPRAVSIQFKVCPECLSPDLAVDRNGVVLCRQCLALIEIDSHPPEQAR